MLAGKTYIKPAVWLAVATGLGILGAVSPAVAASPRPKAAPTALPTITIISPVNGASYERRARVPARFRCRETGTGSRITSCTGTVAWGHRVNTRSVGRKSFTVTAVDSSGNRAVKTIHYRVWKYVNPLKAVSGLYAGRIDMGVDYAGSGPVRALGKAKVMMASNTDSGPSSCWGRTCWPGGGIVVYRLLDGPFAGKYVYVAENVTASVRAGQKVFAGERIAVVHPGYPYMETGWASGHGAETLAFAHGHECTCGDPGGWSSIEGRNFDHLLTALGAPSGYLQPNQPNQRMPHNWPRQCSKASPGLCSGAKTASLPTSRTPMSEGTIRFT